VFDKELFERKIRKLADGYKKRFGDMLQYDVEEEIARFNVRRASHLPCLLTSRA
jgi:adenylosuccinate synthase